MLRAVGEMIETLGWVLQQDVAIIDVGTIMQLDEKR